MTEEFEVVNLSPFDYINTISQGKELLNPDFDRYPAFTINRGLSNHWDTCILANEMNIHPDILPEAQFVFLSALVTNKKRYGKWAKKTSDDTVKLIMKSFDYSETKAKEALTILSEEDIEDIRNKQPNVGGSGRQRKTRKKKGEK